MGLRGLMKMQPVTVVPGMGVLDACRILEEQKREALAVCEGENFRGILRERDLITRVLLTRRDPDKVTVAEVMTRDLEPLTADLSPGDALRTMVERETSILPVIEAKGSEKLAGVISLPDLLENEIDHLANELDAVTNYFTSDGIGGD